MITSAALSLLMLSMVAGRWCTRRSLAALSIEQKALVMDASSRGNIWSLVSMAIIVLVPWPLVHVDVHYRLGVLATFLATLFLLPLATAGSRLLRLSRLGLPKAYIRNVGFGAILFQVGLFLLICAIIYDVSKYHPR
jgi:hypothetical protein